MILGLDRPESFSSLPSCLFKQGFTIKDKDLVNKKFGL
jgi:hypothetical protein